MRRIYPVYVVGIVAGVALIPFAHGDAVQQSCQALGSLFGTYAFMPFGAPPNNEILSVVAVFVWMYVSYPLIAKVQAKSGWIPVIAFFLVMQGLAIIAARVVHPDAAWFGRSYYIMSLYWVIGALASDKVNDTKLFSGFMNVLAAVLLFSAYLLVCDLLKFQGSHFIKSLLFALWFAWLTMVLARLDQTARHTYLARVFARIGVESYSLYAIHFPILIIAGLLEWNPFISLFAVFVAAHLFYELIEQPFWRRPKKENLVAQ